jgi:hypothetical protein
MGRVENLENILGPFLCRMHPGAETLSISMRGRIQPTIEKSRFQGNAREAIGDIQTQYVTDVHCKGEVEP